MKQRDEVDERTHDALAIPQVTASDASVTERSRINPAPVGGKCQQSAISFAAG